MYNMSQCECGNPSFPFMNNNHYNCDCCKHMVPPPPPPAHNASGFMKENAFTIVNSIPYVYDNTSVKYGQFTSVSENIITKVVQRPEDSCLNLQATFDMTNSHNANAVMNHYLVQIMQNKYKTLNGILPVVKSFTKFKLYYTITDSQGGTIREDSEIVTSHDMKLHATDIDDYLVTSCTNLLVTNIPAMDYQGLYTLTLTKIEAYVDYIDTQSHISEGLNPYYQFINTNAKIAIQHETIVNTTADGELLIASCDINKAFAFQSNLTTRLKVSFNAYMSNVISTENTFTVWEALNEPTEAVIADLKASIETLKAENATFLSEITQLKSDITSLTADDVKTAAAINTINTTLTDHSNLINTNKTNIASLDVRVTALEKTSV